MYITFWSENLKGRDNLEDKIRMDLREIGWKVVDWKHMAQDRSQLRAFVNMVMNLRVPCKAGNFLTSRVTINSGAWSQLIT
jgi:hypothetical protein